ncbi:MGH1-like glycoside hydrolase domain-containing protein, partial [Singulisphaera rosea]
LEQGGLSVVVRASQGIDWPAGTGSMIVPPSGRLKLHVAFAMGPSAEAKAACDEIASAAERALEATRTAYADRLAGLFAKLPRLRSSSQALDQFYNRSLVPLLMNRWDVAEFALHPYYATGSVNGGCVGNYLWDFGGNWEIFPLYDPEATKSHIKQFLAVDITKHFAFEPITGKAWGPWYPVNQEKIVGLIYFYVKHTGDLAFLKEVVDGKTILDHAVANALFGDDPGKPVRLIDYGPSNSHLELRRGIPYNHVMPDLNGRRYDSYVRAAELAELAGTPMPPLRERASALKAVLKQQLWDQKAKWFAFQDDKGRKDLRYTVQVFKLFSSEVLDAEQEAGLLTHLRDEREFMAEYGLESMAKTDLAYDPVDYDNGGGGCFTAFPAQVAERLYKAGHPRESSDILKRILWWGERTPYWGDSFAANEIQYRRDTPLQCTIDAAAAAQCIIFGMFGVRAEFNGDLRINPTPASFAPKMELNGLRLRGHVLDIRVDGGTYEIQEGPRRTRQAVGQPTILRSR